MIYLSRLFYNRSWFKMFCCVIVRIFELALGVNVDVDVDKDEAKDCCCFLGELCPIDWLF